MLPSRRHHLQRHIDIAQSHAVEVDDMEGRPGHGGIGQRLLNSREVDVSHMSEDRSVVGGSKVIHLVELFTGRPRVVSDRHPHPQRPFGQAFPQQVTE